jgi:hypothetical protein
VADNAERGVVFTLKAQVDPASRQIIDSFANDLKSRQSQIDELIANSASAIAQTMAQTTSTAASSSARVTQINQDAVSQFFDNTEQAAKAWEQSQAKRATDEAARQAATKDASLMTIEELYAEREAAGRAAFDREKSIYESALAEEEQAFREYFDHIEELKRKALDSTQEITDEEVQLAHDLERAAVDSIANREKAEDRFRKAETRERQRSVSEAIQGIARQDAEHERAAAATQRRNEQISASAGRIISAMSEGTEAVMRFARGISHLGLIGETDLQKLTDSLLAIQGTTEIFTGLIRTIKQVSEGWDAYRRMVILTTEAQIALNAAQATGVAISAASGGVGQRAAGSAVGGIAGGVAGGVAGGAIGGAAGGSILGSLATSATIAGAGIGTGLGAINVSTAGMSGIGILGTATAALTLAVADIVMFAQLVKEARAFGIGGGATQGGFVDVVGSSRLNPFAYQAAYYEEIYGEDGMSPGRERDLSAKRLTEAEKFRAQAVKMAAEDERRINELVRERETLQRSQEQSQREANAHRMSMLTAEERRADIINQIAKAENDQSLGLQERARQVKSLSEQRLQVEREIYQEQRRAAQETLDKAKQELATKEQQLRTAQEAAMSAQERFGLLAPEEQQALLEARQQFQAGAGNVDVESLRKLRGFSGALDEQIAGEARRRAQQAGFGAFQGEDLRRIQQLEAERQRIQVQVQAQANVIAKLEIDVESVSKEINKQISAQWKTILEDLASNIATLQANENKLNQQRIGRFNRVGP